MPTATRRPRSAISASRSAASLDPAPAFGRAGPSRTTAGTTTGVGRGAGVVAWAEDAVVAAAADTSICPWTICIPHEKSWWPISSGGRSTVVGVWAAKGASMPSAGMSTRSVQALSSCQSKINRSGTPAVARIVDGWLPLTTMIVAVGGPDGPERWAVTVSVAAPPGCVASLNATTSAPGSAPVPDGEHAVDYVHVAREPEVADGRR